MKIFIQLIIICLCSNAVFAGEVGNGGDGVLCLNGPNRSVEFYDLYEGREVRLMFADLGDPQLQPEQKVAIVLNRLSRLNPSRAAKYIVWAKTFFDESLIAAADLIDISDAGVQMLPERCSLVQVAVQAEPSHPSQPRYLIDKEYWDLMDNNSKAALVLHELILRETMNQKRIIQPDTVTSRYFNAFIMSPEMQSSSLHIFNEFLCKYGFELADDQHGVPFQLSHCYHFPSLIRVKHF